MSDVSLFTFPNLGGSEDDFQFNPVWEGISPELHQELPRSYSLQPMSLQMGHADNLSMYGYRGHNFQGQPHFGYSGHDDHSRSGILRVDTGVHTPQLQVSPDTSSSTSVTSTIPQTPLNTWGVDPYLRVHGPPRTPLSPSGPYICSAVSPTNQKGLSPALSPVSPHSPAAMGSSDEGLSSLAIDNDDDDDDEEPQPMEHVRVWRSIREMAIIVTGTNIYIPQTIYQPYTEADRVRYIKKANLKEPIVFLTSHPDQWGISLEDALRAKMKDLQGRDDSMFVDCGPSVSIRLQWPGYRAWTKQIPTMDFKSPKCPITKGKLAKNVANCVKRFIEEKETERMETDTDRRWKVGTRNIKMEDLILVSLHHISKGSWQPQLRLRIPLDEIRQRRASHIPPPSK